jgi:hypothetical protein
MYGSSCPGIVAGNFTGGGTGYALNLVMQSKGKFLQELLVFLPNASSHKKFVLLAPMEIGQYSVVVKMPPGRYRNAERDRHVVTKYDSIALTVLEAGTVQYYWDGEHFKEITTSE